MGLWARRDRIQHHRDDVVKRKKGGKKKERWEGLRKIIQHDHMTSEFQRTCE